jgi:hypothetical protein
MEVGPRAVPEGLLMPKRRLYLICSVSLAAFAACISSLTARGFSGSPEAPRVDTLRSVAALPPHLAAGFADASAFRQAPSGEYLVVDRRAHTIYAIDRDLSSARPVVRIGAERGRILQPFGFDVDDHGLLIIGDSPGNAQRIQVFARDGTRLGGFSLPAGERPRVQIDGIVVNGVSSLQATSADSILLNQPESGFLISEYDYDGRLVRSFGHLRATGQEHDRLVHLAMNSGVPLTVPGGGYAFVFYSGEPRLRRFDARGTLIYERVMQGRELDRWVAEQPTAWPSASDEDGTRVPIVRPLVRAAAVDGRGNLWVSFTVGCTYVYDADGEKVRTARFQGAGPVLPTSLSFAADGRLLVTPGGYIFQP